MTEEIKQEEKPDMIALANQAAERLEAANKRQEELMAKAALGGKSDAGATAPAPIDPAAARKARTNELLQGTGFKI